MNKSPKHPIGKYSNSELIYWIAKYGWEVHIRLKRNGRMEYGAYRKGETYGWYSGINDREPLERLATKCGIGFPDVPVEKTEPCACSHSDHFITCKHHRWPAS